MTAATILTLANLKGIDLRNPKASDIDWDSYAEHLAKENRFNGATPGVTYPVAQHLCIGSDAILRATGDRQLAGYFVLHDVHEAVLKDLTTPLKRAIAEECREQFGILAEHIIAAIGNLEYRHDAAIHEAAGLPWPMPAAMIPLVKHWDLLMFVTEWRDLMQNVVHPRPSAYAGILPLAEKIEPMRWQTAKLALLNRWRNLLPSFSAPESGTSAKPPTPKRYELMTIAELRDERGYWDNQIRSTTGWGASLAAANEFRSECDAWIRRREAEQAPPVPA